MSPPDTPQCLDTDFNLKLSTLLVYGRFKSTFRDRGLYESFDSLEEFRGKFSRQLQQKLNAHEMFKAAQLESLNRLAVSEGIRSDLHY